MSYVMLTFVLLGDSFGSEWVIYDVGGSRSMVCPLHLVPAGDVNDIDAQRHAWLPYFDAVNAIIFRSFQSFARHLTTLTLPSFHAVARESFHMRSHIHSR